MIYITHANLMRESESSVRSCARSGSGETAQRACRQLVDNRPRYTTWISGHERRMDVVARARIRDRQITQLRLVATEQVHRAAIVSYLRDNHVTGKDRDLLLGEFYGALDPSCAVIAEHKIFIRAVSSQVCATDLLELCNDRFGVRLLSSYERQYNLYFAMYCDRARARAAGRPYLLASLLPEAKATAKSVRESLLSGANLPPARMSAPRSYQ